MDDVQLRAELLQLQDEDGNYVVTEFGGSPRFRALVQYIQQRDAAIRIETATHVKDICPVTEGWSVERLHNRIDTYIGQLRRESGQAKEEG